MLWGLATIVLVLLVELAEGTNAGLRQDLGEAAGLIPRAVRQLALAIAQVAALLVPVVVAAILVLQRRWRRIIVLVGSAVAGAAVFLLLDRAVGLGGPVPESLGDDSWLISTRFPSPTYLAAAAAATVVGKPWLGRSWRRTADRRPGRSPRDVAHRRDVGARRAAPGGRHRGLVGAAVLVAVGAPNRRPSPLAVAEGLRRGGLDVAGLSLERAVGGRAQLYRATLADGRSTFVKVYARDSRDADLLYRGYRAAILRDAARRVARRIARARRRARRPAPAARPPGRRARPRAPGPDRAARRIDGRRDGGCRRPPARRARGARSGGGRGRLARDADDARQWRRSPRPAGGQHPRH